MKELTIEILAAYLPYGVVVQYKGITNGDEIKAHNKTQPNEDNDPDKWIAWANNIPAETIGTKTSTIKRVEIYRHRVDVFLGKQPRGLKRCFLSNIKLHIRPLSQLTETIEQNGERFVPMDRLCTKFGNGFDYTMMQGEYDAPEFPYMVVTYLHSLHFDTFGLIEAGLAIPIPSIQQP